jgi:hypothetical protein
MRHAKRLQVFGGIEFHNAPPTRGVLPGFGRDPKLEYPEFAIVKISAAGLVMLGRKIVRGLTYKLENRFIDDAQEEVGVYFLHDADGAEILGLIGRFGSTFHKGPGITVKRAISADGSHAGLFLFDIWGKLRIYASLLPKSTVTS